MLESVFKSNKDSPQEVMNFTDVNPFLISVDVFKKDIIDFARREGIS